MNPAETILQPYHQGRASVLVSGRTMNDLDLDPDKSMVPIWELLRVEGRRRFGFLQFNFSFAMGPDVDLTSLDDDRDRRKVTAVQVAHGLDLDTTDPVAAVRALFRLMRAPTDGLTWADGSPMRFVLVVKYPEHLAPEAQHADVDQRLMTELLCELSESLALRASGNLLIISAPGMAVDDRLRAASYEVRLPFPAEPEKRAFMDAGFGLYTDARLEDGLSIEIAARMSARTPNRAVEALIRASDRTGSLVTAAALSNSKAREVELLSEGTLRLLDSGMPGPEVELVGTNISVPAALLDRYAEGLMRGDRDVPRAVLLAGPPATGKTQLALRVAKRARVPAYQLISPLDQWVGGTQRKARLQQRALAELTPNISWIDEITDAFNLSRGQNLDSGSSANVQSEFLGALSNDDLRGQSLLLSATNRPMDMTAQMRDRFTIIPVLAALRGDFPAIVDAIARRLDPLAQIDPLAPEVRAATDALYDKGATPRALLQVLSEARRQRDGIIDASTLKIAARNYCESADRKSSVYADLTAVAYTKYLGFLPWAADPSNYDFPEHLRDVVDRSAGEIDRTALNRRIAELAPHANV